MADSLEWKALLDSLIQRSGTLEQSAHQERNHALQALEDLNELSSLTEQSFARMIPPAPIAAPDVETARATTPASEATPAATPAPRAPTPPPKVEVKVSDKYQGIGALKDESVLSALLDYHTLRGPVRGATTAPKPAAASSPAPTRRPHGPVAPQFSPAEIPIVDDLQHKDPPRKSIRSAQPTAPVLRPKAPRT